MKESRILAASIVGIALISAAALLGYFLFTKSTLRQYFNSDSSTTADRKVSRNTSKENSERKGLPTDEAAAEKALDETVKVVSVANCWSYQPKEISIEGKLFETYGVLTYGCDSGEYITFDVRGWGRFEGYAAILGNDSRPNLLTIKVDEEVVAEHQLNYGRKALPISLDLTGHKTLTFKKEGRYPEMIICEPKLFR